MVSLALAALVAVIFQREIRIAYHKSQLYTSVRYWVLANPSTNIEPPPRPTRVEMIMLALGRGKYTSETERMESHTKALLGLGYFVEEKISLKNRFHVSGTNLVLFHKLTVERFDFGKQTALTNNWWSLSGTTSNQIVVTTTTNLLPRWRKLVEDFDQP